MFGGQGKNCTYTYVSIFKNNVIPLHGKIFALYSNMAAETLYSDDGTAWVLWNLKLPLHTPGHLLCVWIHAAAQRGASCVDLLGWRWLPAPWLLSSDSHAHKGSIGTNTGGTAAVFGQVPRWVWTWCTYPCHALVTSRCCHLWFTEPRAPGINADCFISQAGGLFSCPVSF